MTDLRERITQALSHALLSLESDGPRAIARPRDTGGWAIEIRNTTFGGTIELPDWNEFAHASAGHRLIEHGWMVHPSAHVDPTRSGAGWVDIPGGYSAPIVPATGDPGACSTERDA